MPDLATDASWVQVIGRVVVHHRDKEPHRLTGSGQRLLAVLVAAGPDGATAERIAEEIWGDTQPDPWRPALRMAVARLRKHLPDGWDVVAESGSYHITAAGGWIDAWQLDTMASNQVQIVEDDLAWMLAGQPFAEVDSLEMVGASAQHLQMLQITVAELFCAQTPVLVTTTTCSALTALLRDHPYNDRLALAIAQTLADAQRRTEALLALTAFADSYAVEFGVVPADVTQFLASGGHSDAPPGSRVNTADSPKPIVAIAKELRHLLDDPLLGRASELEALRATRGALVTGVTGAGKSRLLAAVISEDATTETTYVVGDDRLDLALGPFAVAMPTLRDELLSADAEVGLRDEGSAERAASTRAWRIVLAHLEARAAVHPQRLVVDDAHLLDPASLGLLRLLIRSNTIAELTFIVCGRSDFDDVEWNDLVRDAERAGLDPIEVAGLELGELELMVLAEFPGATRQARHGLAVDVYDASGGLPAVAAPLIASADPETLALPEQLAGASALARLASTSNERSPEVVAAAAVLGHQFSIGALIALTELDEATIFRVLDELWSSGVIVETDDPDQVRFQHVLIQRAFLEGVPLFRRGQLHRRAAELTLDPHERADHHASAGALVPIDVAAKSLLESAQLYAEARMWRKVARELRRIDELSSDLLDASSLTLWAAALDQSGADGSTYRRAAYDQAAAVGDWSAALAAALSGLPQAELPDGDRDRIEMLAGIPQDKLPQSDWFDRVFNLSRQLSLMGEYSEGVKHADQALQIAADADEVALSHVMRWQSTRHVDPVAHTIPDEVGAAASPRILTRVAQINAINLAEQGDTEGSRRESERFLDLAMKSSDPLRLWHAQSMQGMYLLNDGDFDAAEALSVTNLQFADLHDLQRGAASFVGQQVYSYDCQDRLSDLGRLLDPYRADLQDLLLGQVAILLSDHALGQTDIGDGVQQAAEHALGHTGSTFSLLTQLFLSRFLIEYAPEFVAPTRSLLERYGDRPILASFGAGSFGPTTRYVAQLTDDLDEKMRLVQLSIDAAERHGPLLWRIRTRLDLADLGSQAALDDASELAAGTQLAAVVARRAAQLG